MKNIMQRFLHSEHFWTIVSILLVIWIIYAIGHNAIATAKYNPVGFLSLVSPLGLMSIIGMLGPGFIPGILLVGTLTMRNKCLENKKTSQYSKINKF